ncbi:MAG TPA: GNAT family N-acetyltransferase [archaeon]|nr:GNAT family N-acetyltransferase [archaeon]
MEIRNARTGDVDKLVSFLKQTKMYNKYIDKKSIITNKILYDRESIIIAKNEAKIIGTIFLIFDPWKSHIHHFIVSENYRNNGIGTKLLAKAEKVLKKRKCTLATLSIDKGNEVVIKFYRKRNWTHLTYKSTNLEKDL